RSLLRSGLRVAWLLICRRPSGCIRWDSRFRIRTCSSSENSVVPAISNSRVTLVSTLFTCCPPAPPLREVWNCTNGKSKSASIRSICVISVQSTVHTHVISATGKPPHQHGRNIIARSIEQGRHRIDQRSNDHHGGNGFGGKPINRNHQHLTDIATIRNTPRHDTHQDGDTNGGK